MNEKKFTYIVISVAIIAILIVILTAVPWGGDKVAIMKEFDSLDDKNHVYETISYEDVMKKIESGETFQVFVGSKNQLGTEQFVFVTNELAKQYEIATIYYLNYDKLTNHQLTNIKIASSTATTFPTLIFWENDGATSTAFHISGLKKFETYNSNWFDLLTEYFNECYE